MYCSIVRTPYSQDRTLFYRTDHKYLYVSLTPSSIALYFKEVTNKCKGSMHAAQGGL